jgi:hypothetical protein
LRRVNVRTLDLLVAIVVESVVALAIARLLHELVVQWARFTGRM